MKDRIEGKIDRIYDSLIIDLDADAICDVTKKSFTCYRLTFYKLKYIKLRYSVIGSATTLWFLPLH
jgi:hypothetical protein